MKLLVLIVGLSIAAIGAVGIAAPSALLDVARSLQTPVAFYVVASVRVAIGIVLVLVSSVSRAPIALRVLGAVVIIGSLAAAFLGAERSLALLDWLSAQGSGVARVWAGVAVALGLFLVYAVLPPRRTA